MTVEVDGCGRGTRGVRPERLCKPVEGLGTDPIGEGTGRGLGLGRNRVQAMQGDGQVMNRAGQGCSFIVLLPAAQVTAPRAIEQPPAVRQETPTPAGVTVRGKVLCIEDNLSSMALIETLLQRRPGIQLLSSMLGQLGLDLARQHAPDLILLDVNLPDLQGLEVLQRLRQSAATANVPVLMMTADASDLTQSNLRAAGASAILTKPLHIQAFLARLDQHLPEPA